MAFQKMRDGAQIYYAVEGTGPSVIMIHGWKASSDVYAQAVEHLKNDFRCVRYDQRGHKRSSIPDRMPVMEDLADDLHELITALAPGEKPFLIGWSMGGATILEYIRKYGCEDLCRIIIVDISPCILNDETWKLGKNFGSYKENDLAEDLALMRTDFRSFLRKMYTENILSYKDMTPAQQDAIITQRMDGFDPSVMTSLWDSLCHADYRDVLPKITVPAAVFYPTIVPRCRPETAAYYASRIPGGILSVEFQNATHSLIAEYPLLFAQSAKEFLLKGEYHAAV